MEQTEQIEQVRKSIHDLENNTYELLEKQRKLERLQDQEKHEELNGIIASKEMEISTLRNKLESMSLSMELLMKDLSKSEEVRKHMHD